MIRTYKQSMTNPMVRKDIGMNAEIKGTTSGKKGRHSIRPEQFGHDVKTSGGFEYCLDVAEAPRPHISRARKGFAGEESLASL
eukprot:10489648-Heterocapsa_arctica.AAC.1